MEDLAKLKCPVQTSHHCEKVRCQIAQGHLGAHSWLCTDFDLQEETVSWHFQLTMKRNLLLAKPQHLAFAPDTQMCQKWFLLLCILC